MTTTAEQTEKNTKTKKKYVKWVLIIGIPILCLLLIAAAIYAMSVKYKDKAVPGSILGGVKVSGMNKDELVSVAQDLFDSIVFKLNIDDRSSPSKTEFTIKPTDIKMKLDADATAEAVMERGDSSFIFARYIPMVTKDTVLAISYNPKVLRDYLRAKAPKSFLDPVNPAVTYDAKSQTFIVTPGKNGYDLSDDQIEDIMHDAAETPEDVEMDLALTESKPSVPDETAQETADKATSLTKLSLKFSVKGGKSAEASEDNIASMLTFTPNIESGDMDLGVSREKVLAYIDGPLSDQLGKNPQNQRQIEDGNGNTLLIVGESINGEEIAEPAVVAASIEKSLNGGVSLSLEVGLTVEEATTEKVLPKEGERWAEVNLSTQRAFFYEGSKLIRTCIISSGTAGHRTRVGDFKVWLKVRMQDMQGGSKKDKTFYLTKNVPWISYFDRDIAFHHAYWHNNFGTPMSHGCINMNLSDAMFQYDYLKIGDRVIVHY